MTPGIRKRSAPAGSIDRRAGIAVRRTAIEIVRRVGEDGAFADVLLGHHIDAFEPADRRLLTLLVLGTIAWQGRIDYELERLSNRAVSQIAPAILAILRVGLFQLRFMDRVPRHAAVDTAVEIAKHNVDTARAAGLINAVLRRAATISIGLPPRHKDQVGYLAIAWSHPRWLVEKFIEWFGSDQAARLMAANNAAAPNVIRLNLARGTHDELLTRLRGEGLEPADGGILPETVILRSAVGIGPSFSSSGLYYVQSESSQWIARLLAPTPGAVIVDCAAAPGGKASHLAELAGPKGRVIALDINHAGVLRARKSALTLGHRNIDFVCADLTAATPFRAGQFEFVMLDAPCTGLGTLREHPEIRWRLKPDDPARMGQVQLRMLTQAAGLLRPGGAIVYSVCSLAPEEGPHVIGGFLGQHPEFAIERKPDVHPALADELQSDGALVTRPDLDGRDGFFAVRLKRVR